MSLRVYWQPSDKLVVLSQRVLAIDFASLWSILFQAEEGLASSDKSSEHITSYHGIPLLKPSHLPGGIDHSLEKLADGTEYTGATVSQNI
jgi:hypothetical protein